MTEANEVSEVNKVNKVNEVNEVNRVDRVSDWVVIYNSRATTGPITGRIARTQTPSWTPWMAQGVRDMSPDSPWSAVYRKTTINLRKLEHLVSITTHTLSYRVIILAVSCWIFWHCHPRVVLKLEANDPPKSATFDRSVAGLTGTDWQVDRYRSAGDPVLECVTV